VPPTPADPFRKIRFDADYPSTQTIQSSVVVLGKSYAGKAEMDVLANP
jgi:hypothetical protein